MVKRTMCFTAIQVKWAEFTKYTNGVELKRRF